MRHRADVERHAFAQVDRCGLVVQSEDPQRHRSGACSKLLAHQGRHFTAHVSFMPEMILTRLAMLALVALAPVALAAPSTRPV
jgi:hypothetical protein